MSAARSLRTHLLRLLPVAGGLLVSGNALAQDRALADDLFTQGKALYDAGKYAEACPKLADSQHADPQIGTLLNLALCHDKEGKTASAYAEYKDTAALAAQKGQQERVDFARKGVADIEPKLSRITFVVESRARGEVVKLDEQVVPESLWGSPFARDPGAHVIEVSAPGKATWKQPLTIARGPASAVVNVPALQDAPAEKPAATPSVTEQTSGINTKSLGYIVGGVGVAGLAVGGIFGLMYLGKQSDNNKTCVGSPAATDGVACNGDAVHAANDLKSSAETLGLVSTVGFIAGVVGVGVGAYLVLTSKSSDKSASQTALRLAPTGGPQGGGLRLEGAF